MKWKYLIFEMSLTGFAINVVGGQNEIFARKLESLSIIEALNWAGDCGWELVAVLPAGDGAYKPGERFFLKKRFD